MISIIRRKKRAVKGKIKKIKPKIALGTPGGVYAFWLFPAFFCPHAHIWWQAGAVCHQMCCIPNIFSVISENFDKMFLLSHLFMKLLLFFFLKNREHFTKSEVLKIIVVCLFTRSANL